MIALCGKAREVRGEVAGEVTGEVRHPFRVLNREHGRQEHQERLHRNKEDILRTVNLLTALELRWSRQLRGTQVTSLSFLASQPND